MERKRNGREEPDEVRFFWLLPGEAAASRRLMRGELAWPNDEREGRAKSALIRRCGATFSLRVAAFGGCADTPCERSPSEKALEKEANHAYKNDGLSGPGPTLQGFL